MSRNYRLSMTWIVLVLISVKFHTLKLYGGLLFKRKNNGFFSEGSRFVFGCFCFFIVTNEFLFYFLACCSFMIKIDWHFFIEFSCWSRIAVQDMYSRSMPYNPKQNATIDFFLLSSPCNRDAIPENHLGQYIHERIETCIRQIFQYSHTRCAV